MKTSRNEVFEAIDGERSYQDRKWGKTLSSGREGDGYRSIDEYALYIVGYAHKLLDQASSFACAEDKLHAVRKVAGLCVACMEEHGAPTRKITIPEKLDIGIIPDPNPEFKVVLKTSKKGKVKTAHLIDGEQVNKIV